MKTSGNENSAMTSTPRADEQEQIADHIPDAGKLVGADGLVERLRKIGPMDDHARGCDGRTYACSCGYDARKDALIARAADRIEALAAELGHVSELADERAERMAELFHEKTSAEARAAEQRLAEARAALEPLARQTTTVSKYDEGSKPWTYTLVEQPDDARAPCFQIKYGDIRKARSILTCLSPDESLQGKQGDSSS